MESIKPISSFHQFGKNEALAIIDAKTSKVSEIFERELRDMQEKTHTTIRESIKEQIEFISQRIERNASDIQTTDLKIRASMKRQYEAMAANIAQNTNDIRSLLGSSKNEGWQKEMEKKIQKNLDNIQVLDGNVRELATS